MRCNITVLFTLIFSSITLVSTAPLAIGGVIGEFRPPVLPHAVDPITPPHAVDPITPPRALFPTPNPLRLDHPATPGPRITHKPEAPDAPDVPDTSSTSSLNIAVPTGI
ncbi:hypothetical protein K501DRAFT_282789, partial [Backusella circina FSU 941]